MHIPKEYRVSARDLRAAEEEVRRAEARWRAAQSGVAGPLRWEQEEVRRAEARWRAIGFAQVSHPDVAEACRKAETARARADQAQPTIHFLLSLGFYRLVQFCSQISWDSWGMPTIVGGSAAIVFVFSAVISLLVSSSVSTILLASLLPSALAAALASLACLFLWPTEKKLETARKMEQQRLERQALAKRLEDEASHALDAYERLREYWEIRSEYERACKRLDEAKEDLRREYERAYRRLGELKDLLNSAKYRLLHTDWRSLRGVPFEKFLGDAFAVLGYSVQETKASGDQGIDLIVTGKGKKIGVQVKGYAGSVGNSAVQEAHAGKTFYRCDACVVITNSCFTQAARELARAVGCALIDGEQIPDLIVGRIY